MKKGLLIAAGLAAAILWLGVKGPASVSADQEYRYFTSNDAVGAETVGVRARDMGSGNYFYGLWTVTGRVQGVTIVTFYRIKYNGTTRSYDSTRVILPATAVVDSNHVVITNCLGDSAKIHQAGATSNIVITVVGGADSQRGVNGPLLY